MTALQDLAPLSTPCVYAAVGILAIPTLSHDARGRLSRAELLTGLAARQHTPAATPRRRLAATGHPAMRAGIASAAAGFAFAMVVGGLTGVLAGSAAAAVGARVLSRLEPAAGRRLHERRRDELPAVLSLLAAALSAGLPLSGALSAVADATGGALAPDLARVGELSALGAGPAAAWADWSDDPLLGPVARAATRSADSGSALATALRELAAESRADAQLRAEEAARRAGALATAPLGLCFLPAFLCLGVVPVVIGIAQQVLP